MGCYSLFLITGCTSTLPLTPVKFGTIQHVDDECPDSLPNRGIDTCKLYEVPLDWQHPDEGSINVFLRVFKRPSAENIHSKGQIWVIDGGPGASGATFSDPKFVELIHSMGWDLYIPTHRGVGFSTELDCGITFKTLDEVFVENCSRGLARKYGDNLNWFSSIGAAYDLNHLIKNNNQQDLPVVIMGTSYGTLVTQRFLQQFDRSINAAVLVSGTHINPRFENVVTHQEDTLKRLLKMCDQQVECADMFSSSAYGYASNLILDNGRQQCETTQANPMIASQIIGYMASSHALREDLPLTIKRLTRCNEADVKHLTQTTNKIGKLIKQQYEQLFQFNPIALHHQIFTEMLSADLEYLDAFELPKNTLLGDSISPYLKNKSDWPTHQPPMKLPDSLQTELPVLTLHGGLDMQAHVSWFEELTSQLNGDNQHTVLFKDAGHGTPNYSELQDGTNCSWQLVEAFINNPGTKLDISCVKEVPPLVFNVE